MVAQKAVEPCAGRATGTGHQPQFWEHTGEIIPELGVITSSPHERWPIAWARSWRMGEQAKSRPPRHAAFSIMGANVPMIILIVTEKAVQRRVREDHFREGGV